MKIQVPNSLSEIRLCDFQEFIAISNPTEEDYFRLFLKIDDISNIKITSVNSVVDSLNKLFETEETELTERFEFKGVNYGFVPKLDDITYGENKDITKYINDWSSMHKALSVLYRPITSSFNMKYLIEPYEGSDKFSEAFKELPLSVAFGAKVFFCNLIKDLANCIPSYLEKEVQEATSTKSMANIQTFLRSQMGMLQR